MDAFVNCVDQDLHLFYMGSCKEDSCLGSEGFIAGLQEEGGGAKIQAHVEEKGGSK
jgi:hypothetical protein